MLWNWQSLSLIFYQNMSGLQKLSLINVTAWRLNTVGNVTYDARHLAAGVADGQSDCQRDAALHSRCRNDVDHRGTFWNFMSSRLVHAHTSSLRLFPGLCVNAHAVARISKNCKIEVVNNFLLHCFLPQTGFLPSIAPPVASPSPDSRPDLHLSTLLCPAGRILPRQTHNANFLVRRSG